MQGDQTLQVELLHAQRRTLLKAAAVAVVGSFCLPKIAFAKVFQAPEKSIRLYHAHTGEFLKTTFWAQGDYCSEGLRTVNHFLRDYRTNITKNIDPSLLDLLYVLSLKLGTQQPFQIVSAYRSPETNALLRRHSRGVAKHSYHTKGQAVDIRLPSTSLRNLHHAALSLQAGGVGYYGRSNFVHVDTGPVRKWGG